MHQPSWEYFDVVQAPPPLIRWESPFETPCGQNLGTWGRGWPIIILIYIYIDKIYGYIYMIIHCYMWLYSYTFYISIIIHLLYCPYLLYPSYLLLKAIHGWVCTLHAKIRVLRSSYLEKHVLNNLLHLGGSKMCSNHRRRFPILILNKVVKTKILSHKPPPKCARNGSEKTISILA